jgi:hypothetical protein
MNAAPKRVLGWSLVLLGATAVIFCQTIVFPGLERLIGIETIVGKENVHYLPDSGYGYTNPGAMMRWISSVAASGIVICLIGIFLLIRASRDRKHLN